MKICISTLATGYVFIVLSVSLWILPTPLLQARVEDGTVNFEYNRLNLSEVPWVDFCVAPDETIWGIDGWRRLWNSSDGVVWKYVREDFRPDSCKDMWAWTFSFIDSNNRIFLSGSNSSMTVLIRSTDMGMNFSIVKKLDHPQVIFHQMVEDKFGNLYVCTYNMKLSYDACVYKSIDHGETWELKLNVTTEQHVHCLGYDYYDSTENGTLWATFGDKKFSCFKSTDLGENWEFVFDRDDKPATFTADHGNTAITDMTFTSKYILMGSDFAPLVLFTYVRENGSWTQRSPFPSPYNFQVWMGGMQEFNDTVYIAQGGYPYFSDYNASIWCSPDGGDSWIRLLSMGSGTGYKGFVKLSERLFNGYVFAHMIDNNGEHRNLRFRQLTKAELWHQAGIPTPHVLLAKREGVQNITVVPWSFCDGYACYDQDPLRPGVSTPVSPFEIITNSISNNRTCLGILKFHLGSIPYDASIKNAVLAVYYRTHEGVWSDDNVALKYTEDFGAWIRDGGSAQQYKNLQVRTNHGTLVSKYSSYGWIYINVTEDVIDALTLRKERAISFILNGTDWKADGVYSTYLFCGSDTQKACESKVPYLNISYSGDDIDLVSCDFNREQSLLSFSISSKGFTETIVYTGTYGRPTFVGTYDLEYKMVSTKKAFDAEESNCWWYNQTSNLLHIKAEVKHETLILVDLSSRDDNGHRLTILTLILLSFISVVTLILLKKRAQKTPKK